MTTQNLNLKPRKKDSFAQKLGPAGKLRLMKKTNSNADIVFGSKGRLQSIGLFSSMKSIDQDRVAQTKLLKGEAR